MDETYVREAIELARCTMYTSTEPCEMCSATIHYAGLDRVVYSVTPAWGSQPGYAGRIAGAVEGHTEDDSELFYPSLSCHTPNR